jgi:transposase
VRNARVWHALLGVDKTVVEAVEFDEGEQILIGRVRAARGAASRCGVCQHRCGRYDTGEGRRRWRALDVGTVQGSGGGRRATRLLPRAGHTRAFDATAAWLATKPGSTDLGGL